MGPPDGHEHIRDPAGRVKPPEGLGRACFSAEYAGSYFEAFPISANDGSLGPCGGSMVANQTQAIPTLERSNSALRRVGR